MRRPAAVRSAGDMAAPGRHETPPQASLIEGRTSALTCV